MGNRHHVQNRIGATAQRHINSKGIIDSIISYDTSGANVFLQKPHNLLPRLLGELPPPEANGTRYLKIPLNAI